MTERATFTVAEEQALKAAVARHETPTCPRCAVVMAQKQIGGGSFGLGYARHRTWLLCPQCRRSVVFDERRGTRT